MADENHLCEALTSPKVKTFVRELRALCDRYGVALSPEGWDLEVRDQQGGGAFVVRGIVDCTADADPLYAAAGESGA